MFLAQTDLPSVPAEMLKWVLIILVSIVIITAVVIGIVSAFRKPAKVQIDDQPPPAFRKSPKTFNYELCKLQHEHIERRLNVLERWRTEEILNNAKRNQRLMFALGKIAQKRGVDIEPAD